MHETLPSAVTMGGVGFAALAANAVSFGILWFFYRTGDANMRSAWICTRNDVLGNLAVLLAALGVFGTGTGWPDVLVAAAMAALALQGASTVLRQSLGELPNSRRLRGRETPQRIGRKSSSRRVARHVALYDDFAEHAFFIVARDETGELEFAAFGELPNSVRRCRMAARALHSGRHAPCLNGLS